MLAVLADVTTTTIGLASEVATTLPASPVAEPELVTTAEDQVTDLMGQWWPIIAMVATPFLTSWLTAEQAEKYLKQGVAVVFTIVFVVLSIIQDGLSELSPETIITRFAVYSASAEAFYRTATTVTRAAGGTSFNKIGIFKPGSGLGAKRRPPEPVQPPGPPAGFEPDAGQQTVVRGAALQQAQAEREAREAAIREQAYNEALAQAQARTGELSVDEWEVDWSSREDNSFDPDGDEE